MISISSTLRRISEQLKTNLNKRKNPKITRPTNKAQKSVRFNAIDTIYFTHSSAEYDRTPLEESAYYL